jgi:hypothetical protein
LEDLEILEETLDSLNTTNDDITNDDLTNSKMTEEELTTNSNITNDECKMNNYTNLDLESLNNMVDNVNHKITRKPIMDTINKLTTFVRQFFTPFQETPKQTAVIYIANHGGYYFENNLLFKTFKCPILNSIRLKYSPFATCAWNTLPNQIQQITNIITNLKDVATNKSNITDSPCAIVENIKHIKEYNLSHPFLRQDQGKITNTKPDAEELKIHHNIKSSNEIVVNEVGDLIVNKTYITDINNDPSGIFFLFDVEFRLPDVFFELQNESELNKLTEFTNGINNAESRFEEKIGKYSIGKYNTTTKTIKYNANTELLSCPFFMLYLNFVFVNNDDNIVKAISLSEYINATTETIISYREMIYKVDSVHIYNYLKYVNVFVNLDYSCAALMFPNEIKEKIKKMNKISRRQYIKRILNSVKVSGVKGGKNNTNRRRTKRRQKKCYKKRQTKRRVKK